MRGILPDVAALRPVALAAVAGASSLLNGCGSPAGTPAQPARQAQSAPSAPAGSTEAAALRARAADSLFRSDLPAALAKANAAIQLEPTRAAGYVSRGLVQQAGGELDRALEDFNRALALEPDSVEALAERSFNRLLRNDRTGAEADITAALQLGTPRAETFWARGAIRLTALDVEGAIEDCNRALELNAGESRAYSTRALAKVFRPAPDLSSAFIDAQRGVALAPSLAQAYLARGTVLRLRGELDAAIQDFDQALRLMPILLGSYTERARARLAKRDFGGATNDLLPVLNRGSGVVLAEALTLKGDIKLAQAQFDSAIEDYEWALIATPDFPMALAGRAIARVRKTPPDLAGAEVDAAKAHSLAPKLWLVHQVTAEIATRKGDHAGAEKAWSEAIALAPDGPAGYAFRAAARVDRGQLELARADIARALAIAPRSADALVARSRLHSALKDFATAMRDLDEAVASEPGNYVARNHRAHLALQLAHPSGGPTAATTAHLEKALADLNTMSQLAPDSATVLLLRAGVHWYLGDFAASLADADRVIRLEPSPNAYNFRGRLRGVLGDYANAIADFEREPGEPYSRFFSYVASRRLGHTADLTGLHSAKLPEGWPRSIAAFLANEINETEFLERAQKGDGAAVKGQVCEAHFFAGMVRWFGGEAGAARRHFEQSVATGMDNFTEHQWAKAELTRLPADSN